MEIFYSFESGDAGRVGGLKGRAETGAAGRTGGLQGCAETGAACKVGGLLRLNAEESAHCVRVLRHRVGDSICVVDGRGTMYHCTIESIEDRSAVCARIDSVEAGWHSHPYNLTMAVCPTKNPDRYEWMVEKLCEIGVDTIAPVIGDRSERKVLKTDRLRRLVLSASKQSLKAAFPELAEPVSVRDFVAAQAAPSGEAAAADCGALTTGCGPLRVIAYCSDEVQPRASLSELLASHGFRPHGILPASPSGIAREADGTPENPSGKPGDIPAITVLIGPEGDFSPEEVRAAIDAGFIPVHLGSSRLRTETAAIVAATAVYLRFLSIR